MFPKHSQRRYIISSAATYFVIVVLILLAKTKKGHAHVNGAPARICGTLLPEHGELPMSTADMPYEISTDRRYIRGTGKITIKVTSKDPSKYSLKGVLFVMKQPNDPKNAFGTFDPTRSKEHLQTLDCFGKPGTGLTHTHSRPKNTLTFQWIAPNDTSADYELHATLVRDFNSYWADYIYPHRISIRVDAPASAELLSLYKPLFLSTVAAILVIIS